MSEHPKATATRCYRTRFQKTRDGRALSGIIGDASICSRIRRTPGLDLNKLTTITYSYKTYLLRPIETTGKLFILMSPFRILLGKSVFVRKLGAELGWSTSFEQRKTIDGRIVTQKVWRYLKTALRISINFENQPRRHKNIE